MPVSSLRDSSIKCVSSNLQSITKQCERLSIQIPYLLSNDIFAFYCSNKRSILYEEIDLFSSSILPLTRIIINEKELTGIRNFNFLEGHPIKTLSIIGCGLFNNLPIGSQIEHVEIVKTKFIHDVYIQMEKYFLNCFCLKTITITGIINISSSFKNVCHGLKSSSSSLQHINFSDCRLTVEQGFWLANLLTECTALKTINLSFNREIQNGFERIFNGLKSSSSTLQHINLSSCNLSEEQAFWLGDLLLKCTVLNQISLNSNNDLKKGFEIICNGLKSSSSSLQNIDLSNCNLSGEQGLWLADQLFKCEAQKKIDLGVNEKLNCRFENICNALKSSRLSLQNINLRDCNLSAEQGCWLGDLLVECKTLREINFNYNNNLKKGFEMICKGLASSSFTLQQIHLSDCNFSEEQGFWLGNLLFKCTALTEIDFNYNNDFKNGFERICKGLRYSSSTLKHINLSDCNFSEEQGFWLGDLLFECTAVSFIDLNFSNELKKGFERICNGLKSSSASLQFISLSYCSVSGEQGFCLGDLLTECTALNLIDLNSNDELTKGFERICSGLKSSSSTLKHINLSDCNLSEEQGFWLGNLLINCTELSEIDMNFNNNLKEGFERICSGLMSASFTLQHINLSNCNLSEEQAFSLGDLFFECTTLKQVELNSNNDLKSGFKKICTGLKSSSHSLQRINLSYCNLSEDQAFQLGDLLLECTTLSELDLNSNNNMKKGFDKICNGLESSSSSLEYMNLSNCNLSEEQKCLMKKFSQLKLSL